MAALSAVLLGGCLGLGGCNATPTAPFTGPSTSRSPVATQPPTATTHPGSPTVPGPSPALGSVPPAWLGTRVLKTKDGSGKGVAIAQPTPPELQRRAFTLPDTLPPPTGTSFASTVVRAPADVVARSTWKPGCPVPASQLDYVTVSFWGFDNRAHTGELLVNRTAAADLVRVFRLLFQAKFPIEQMVITTRAQLDAAPTGDGNNTSAFACRPVVGSDQFSQHAYGLAVDINPFQNPYRKGEVVLPELAGSYLDRENRRPGMILDGGLVVQAFAGIGWPWGGHYRTLKDLHHFSDNGG